MKQCEEPFTLITPHICSSIRKAEAKNRKGARAASRIVRSAG